MFSQPEIPQEILVILNAITGHLEVQDLPKAPPISAPLVGIFTLTIPQSDPNGLKDSNIKVLRNL